MRALPFLLAALGFVPPGPASAAASVEVRADPRLELLGVVELLGSTKPSAGFLRHDVEYVRRAEELLGPFRGHPAVSANARLGLSGLDYHRRSDIMARLSQPPELEPLAVIPEMHASLAGGPEALEAWLEALRRFYRESGFPGFLASEGPRLEAAIAPFREAVEGERLLSRIEEYTGLVFVGRYLIVPTPFHRFGEQVNSVVALPDGSYQITSIAGPETAPGGELRFNPRGIGATAWHELGHGLLDTLSELHRESIARASASYRRLSWECYGDWAQCVKEHVVRAVMLRLLALHRGEAAARAQFQEEGGEGRYPFLPRLLELLEEYESKRGAFPTLADFFPRLLEAFPASGAGDQAGRPGGTAAEPSREGPGPEWILEAAAPFGDDGQRARALRVLDLILERSPSPEMLVKRGVLRHLRGARAQAVQDASAALEREPGLVGARLLRGLAWAGLGEAAKAGEDLRAAEALCRAGSRELTACRNVRERLRASARDAAARVFSEPPERRRESRLALSFETDARIELLSVLLALAKPEEFERRYREQAREYFSSSSTHPAVMRLSRWLKGGIPELLPAQILLQLSAVPQLKAPRPLAEGQASLPGGPGELAAWLGELRDFAAGSGFARFQQSRRRVNAESEEKARREARRGLSPETLSDYLRLPLKGRYRFILAPGLPARYCANLSLPSGRGAEELRLRSASVDPRRGESFSFDDFGAGVAHELCHTITDPLAFPFHDELEAYAGLLPRGCTDNWQGCVLEHVVLAVTLRAWIGEHGGEAYEGLLKDFTGRGFPYLEALTERLGEYEKSPARFRDFGDFYPRLVSVFREVLEARIKTAAHDSLSRDPSKSAAAERAVLGASGKASLEVDPRVELVGVVLGLSRSGPAGPWQALAGHPAVAKTRGLARGEARANLALQIVLHLSDPPELKISEKNPLPPGYIELSGGAAALEAWLAELRDFALRARFAQRFESRRPAYRSLLEAAQGEAAQGLAIEAAEAYLGPFQGRYRILLSETLPPAAPAHLTLIRKDGVEEIEVRSRPGGGGEASLIEGFIHAALNALPVPPEPGPFPVKEHLLQAVMLRLLARQRGEAVYEDELKRLSGKALPSLPFFCERLKEFEGQRARYPTLGEFYGELESALKRITLKPAPPRTTLAFMEPPPPTAAGESPALAFMVDPRLELFSAALWLATGQDLAPGFKDAAYVSGSRRHFSRFAPHPLVARLRRLIEIDEQAPLALQHVLLHLSTPPALALTATPPEGYVRRLGGPEEMEALLRELRDFARASGFARFFASHGGDHAGFVSQARRESARAQAPRALAAYMGVPLPGRYAFPLAVLMPQAYAGNLSLRGRRGSEEVRVRAALAFEAGLPRFGLDFFGTSAAHELARTAVHELVPEFSPGGASAPSGCNDESLRTWGSCLQEHIALAVTLRLLAAQAGEQAYREKLRHYQGRGFPYLAGLSEALKVYEARRGLYPSLREFYPRLEEAFLRQVPKAAPAPPRPEDPELARHKALGVKAFLEKDLPAALEHLRRAHARSPQDLEAQLDLGVVCADMGNLRQALSWYDRVISATPATPAEEAVQLEALSSRASLHEKLRRPREALADLEKALRLAPSDWSRRTETMRRLQDLGARF